MWLNYGYVWGNLLFLSRENHVRLLYTLIFFIFFLNKITIQFFSTIWGVWMLFSVFNIISLL